jgi:hypothetical protein
MGRREAMVQKISNISGSIAFLVAKRIFSDNTEWPKTATSTGFIWQRGGASFLITNWHNVTGLNSITGAQLSSFTPSHLEITFKYPAEERDGQILLAETTRRVSLYDDAERPIWVEHPSRNCVDGVAVPIDACLDGPIAPFALSSVDFEHRWIPDIGSDCFIVGYPEGLIGSHRTPIWKRGSIATEPNLDHNDLPLMLVDTLANQGLSGSPVIARSSGVFVPPENE